MTMLSQGEIEVITHCFRGPILGQDSAQEKVAERGGDFHVTQGRNV